jgi:hypothetical protein
MGMAIGWTVKGKKRNAEGSKEIKVIQRYRNGRRRLWTVLT